MTDDTAQEDFEWLVETGPWLRINGMDVLPIRECDTGKAGLYWPEQTVNGKIVTTHITYFG